ncbi:DUF998 domain-containing protein [Caldiplasma sukawensis]
MDEKKQIKYGALIIFIGILIFYFGVNISEFLQPVYSVSKNSISHLGIASYPYIFNGAIILLGITEIIGSYLLKIYNKYFFIFIMLGGIGSAGVGIFNEHFGFIHLVFAFLAFFFGSAASYIVLRKERNFVSVIYATLGTISIVSLVLFSIGILAKMPSFYLGLGEGGMERMIFIPEVLWSLAFVSALAFKNS